MCCRVQNRLFRGERGRLLLYLPISPCNQLDCSAGSSASDGRLVLYLSISHCCQLYCRVHNRFLSESEEAVPLPVHVQLELEDKVADESQKDEEPEEDEHVHPEDLKNICFV
jgi:hypothetical protein